MNQLPDHLFCHHVSACQLWCEVLCAPLISQKRLHIYCKIGFSVQWKEVVCATAGAIHHLIILAMAGGSAGDRGTIGCVLW